MGYLRYYDYLRQIQDAQLKQVITNDDTNRIYTEQAAQAEMISYLVQKYDTKQEFSDTSIFNILAQYPSQQLIELDFVAYSATSTYAINDTAAINGKEYICNTTISTPEAFNPVHWTLLGNQFDLFYLDYPYPLFDVTAIYSKGDIVFWKGKIYTCQLDTQLPNQNQQLQQVYYANIGFYNVFPDNKTNGVQFWGIGQPYSVTGLVPTITYSAWSAGTYTSGQRVTHNGMIWKCIVTSTTSEPGIDVTKWQPENWISGDNRSFQLVQKMVDITLYHLHSRISPRNIPELRIKRYDDAIQWLKDAKNGEVIADIPELQVTDGLVTRYGGQIKNNNAY